MGYLSRAKQIGRVEKKRDFINHTFVGVLLFVIYSACGNIVQKEKTLV